MLEEGFGGGVNCNQGTELRRSISDVCVCVCVCVRVCVQCTERPLIASLEMGRGRGGYCFQSRVFAQRGDR